MCCRTALSSGFSTLRCSFLHGVLKQEFYVIEVTTLFGSNTFIHIEVMKMISFSKYSKFYVDFHNAIEFLANVDGFQYNCV